MHIKMARAIGKNMVKVDKVSQNSLLVYECTAQVE